MHVIGRRTMQSQFAPRHDFENFLFSEFNSMSGLPQPVHDRHEAGMRLVNAAAVDLALDLDMTELDLEDLY